MLCVSSNKGQVILNTHSINSFLQILNDRQTLFQICGKHNTQCFNIVNMVNHDGGKEIWEKIDNKNI